ncbi:MAG: shikimate dehydrogenase [Bacteroidia bacterium]|nr:shikimate dehydrogenase [Bacteroidia bacterium]
MRKFGLIGYPLGHSFSKKYFTEKFSREHIKGCSYENYPLTNISQITDLIRDNELEGLNVTIPYKSSVIKFLDKIDPEAEAIGAVNVIKIKRTTGKTELRGFNSDMTGIMVTLIPVLSPEIKNALVLGTGGSSKAVCHVLKKINVHYTLVSREKKSFCLTYSDINSEILGKTRLIINTTPLGMYPETESKPDLNYDLLGSRHILFDLVYNPEITAFLKMGKERGCTVLSGIKMLHSQAERSWEIWNNDAM